MRKSWTKEELELLEKCYREYVSREEMEKLFPNRTITAICNKAQKMGLPSKYIKPNSAQFKAIYQDYDWCYERYIIKGMTYEEMAKEANCTKRVIEKWCSERHKLNRITRSHIKQLTNEQFQIVMMGTLGDGHIDRRETQHMYIESHAEDQKDYMFWKYEKLKNLCNKPPRYYEPRVTIFNGKEYACQGAYRMETHILHCLGNIRRMSVYEKFDKMNEMGLVLYLLDDGHREKSNWSLCVAALTNEEKEYFLKVCKDKFDVVGKIGNADNRYITFNALTSRKIDGIIVDILGRDLDIVKKKVLSKRSDL